MHGIHVHRCAGRRCHCSFDEMDTMILGRVLSVAFLERMPDDTVTETDTMRCVLNEHSRIQQTLCCALLDTEMHDIALISW